MMNDDMPMMMMQMTFYWGTNATVLFNWWVIDTTAKFVVSFIGIIAAAVFRHALIRWRNQYVLDPTRAKMWGNFVQLANFLIMFTHYALSGLTMLVMMTFNGPLFLAVVLGETIGAVWVDLQRKTKELSDSEIPLCH